MKKLVFVTGVLLLSISLQSQAAKLAASCYMPEETLQVSGKNLDEKMPLASVSKIYTTLMATVSFNLKGQFYTQIYATETEAGSGVYDVHMKGSRDPYFNKLKMHMVISRLNEAKITKIRNLTFDENVKYLHDTDRKFYIGKSLVDPLILKADLNFPAPGLVAAQLAQPSVIMNSYSESQKLANQNNFKLFNKPVFKPAKVSFLSSDQYKLNRQAIKIYVASQDAAHMLKSINWNSNNHAANQMFMVSGGMPKFYKLFYKDFNQSENELTFVNGSGQNHALNGEGRIYNEATCRNTVRTVRILKKAIEAQKKQLSDVMSVVGVDVGSTVGGATYTNPLTRGAVIAKTGTVGTNVTLAGVANTKKGLVYFMFNTELAFPSVKIKRKAAWSAQEDNRARHLISLELQKLIKSYGGPVAFKYEHRNPLMGNLENYDETDLSAAQGLLKDPEPAN